MILLSGLRLGKVGWPTGAGSTARGDRFERGVGQDGWDRAVAMLNTVTNGSISHDRTVNEFMGKLDPAELYDLEAERPDLTGAVLIQALDGFVDAGSTVQIARTHLLGALDHNVVARFDVDQLHDYRARRPIMQFARDHWESYDGPELVLHEVTDDGGTRFLLLTGPEPDVQWERFVSAVQLLIDELGVRLTVGLNAFPMSVPHTRPTHVIAHGSKPELLEGYQPWLGTMGVPASVGHLLEFRLGEAGYDAMGLAATIPPYLSQTGYPAAASAILAELSNRTGLLLPLAALDDAAETTRVAIDQQVAQSDEVRAVVEALEQQYDAAVRERDAADQGPLAGSESDLPSADELAAELESFLAEQANGTDPGASGPLFDR